MVYRIIPISLYAEPQLDKIGSIGDTILKVAGRDDFTLIHESDEAFHYTVQTY